MPSFQKEYVQYWNDPQTMNMGFVVKMLLVMAIGSCFYEDHGTPNTLHTLVRQWIHAAQLWLSAPFEKGRLNLSGLQVQCLLLQARQANAIGPDLVWIPAGGLLRTAFSMGLHRDPKHFPRMSVFQSEMRRRLWATILEMNVQYSLDSGMPTLISFHDFDCEAPSNINDADIGEATKVTPVPQASASFTQTSIQIALLKSLPVRLEIIRLINDFRVEPSYDEILRIGADLTKIMREDIMTIKAQMSTADTNDDPRPTEFHKTLLDVLTRRFLIALHRPFAFEARRDPRFHFSRKVCLDTAMIFMSYLQDAASATSLHNDFARLTVVGGGHFEDVVIHDTTIIICIELITQIREETASTSFTRLARQHLIQGVERVVELSRVRILMGKMNVKAHVFLSAYLAQVKALEHGEPVEKAMIQAAKKGAETCYALLAKMAKDCTGDLTQQCDADASSAMQTGSEQDMEFDFSVGHLRNSFFIFTKTDL